MSALNIPEWVVKEANSLFYKFLWGNKPEKIRRDIIIRDIKEGGLKMVDLEAMVYAQKITWARKLFKEVDRKGFNIPAAYFNPVNIKDYIMSNYREDYLPPTLPAFYSQCLIALLVLKTDKFADSADEALMQRLWFNKYIQINNNVTYYHH